MPAFRKQDDNFQLSFNSFAKLPPVTYFLQIGVNGVLI